MKKVLAAILLVVAGSWTLWADINVTQGSGKTVGTFTDANSREIQQVSARVDGSSNTVIVATISVITNAGASNAIGWDTQASSMPVGSAGVPIGVTVAGNPFYEGAVVSSSSLQTFQTNGKGQYITTDPAGRQIVVGGVPTWMIKSTTTVITANTGAVIIITSAAAGSFNDLCGCVGVNTSATNTYAIFNSTGAFASGNFGADFYLGLPANDIESGFGPANCASPVPQKSAGTNWQVDVANSVTDVRLTCYYYTIAR